MRTTRRNWGEKTLYELFGSQVRADVIAWICGRAPKPFYAAELARKLQHPYAAVHRQLSVLEKMGMLQAEQVGRTKLYRLDESFPLLQGLRQIANYTTGVVARLRGALADEPVAAALIFGSLASGEDSAQSDVDLLVVGQMDSIRLSELCMKVQADTGREINWTNYSPEEFAAKVGEGGSFLQDVMSRPKLFVKGDADALRRLGE